MGRVGVGNAFGKDLDCRPEDWLQHLNQLKRTYQVGSAVMTILQQQQILPYGVLHHLIR